MTANLHHTQLGGFDPTEGEFLKVYELRKAFDDKFSPLVRRDEKENEREEREAAEKTLNDQIKESVGEKRYADYDRASDRSMGIENNG